MRAQRPWHRRGATGTARGSRPRSSPRPGVDHDTHRYTRAAEPLRAMEDRWSESMSASSSFAMTAIVPHCPSESAGAEDYLRTKMALRRTKVQVRALLEQAPAYRPAHHPNPVDLRFCRFSRVPGRGQAAALPARGGRLRPGPRHGGTVRCLPPRASGLGSESGDR